MIYNGKEITDIDVKINLEGLFKKYIEDKGLIKDSIDRKYWTEQYQCLYEALEATMQPEGTIEETGESWIFQKAYEDERLVTVTTHPKCKSFERKVEMMIRRSFKEHVIRVYDKLWTESQYLNAEIYGMTPEEYRETEEYREKHS